MMSPLQKYMMQRQLADGSMGAGGQTATPMGPGVADPYMEGDEAEPLTNPDDGQDEFGRGRKQARPYMAQPGTPSGGPY